MRWLRFAAFGALVPLALFVVLASSVARQETIPSFDFAATQFSAPGLPFESRAFFPAAERAFLPGTDSPARCQVVPGRLPSAWPERAERLGIRSGWVLVEFDLSELGVVENARAIDAAPHAVFEASALRTIERGCRRPEIRGGRAVARSGVRVMVRFEAEGDRT